MAGNEVSLVDIVGALYRVVAETKVGDGDTARLLRVILEVSLDVLIGVVADDLDGVLVGTYCTISSQTPEFTVCCSFRSCYDRSTCLKGKVSNIINDTDCEFLFSSVLIKQLRSVQV